MQIHAQDSLIENTDEPMKGRIGRGEACRAIKELGHAEKTGRTRRERRIARGATKTTERRRRRHFSTSVHSG